MRILVTGNNGYIGSVLTNELLKKKYEVIGYDTDYFYNCNLISTKNKVFKNIKKDIRKITEDDLDGIDREEDSCWLYKKSGVSSGITGVFEGGAFTAVEEGAGGVGSGESWWEGKTNFLGKWSWV